MNFSDVSLYRKNHMWKAKEFNELVQMYKNSYLLGAKISLYADTSFLVHHFQLWSDQRMAYDD